MAEIDFPKNAKIETAKAVRPGSEAFRNFMYARFPRWPGEALIKGYFHRLCQRPDFQRAGISQTRLKDLWYGSYGKCAEGFHPAEYDVLFDLGAGSRAVSEKLVNLRRDLNEARERQRAQNEKMLQGIRQLLEVLEENLSQPCGQ